MMPQYNPESILEEQFESQRQQIQKQFQFQWDDINRQARDNLFKSPKEHESALHDLYTQNKQMMLEFDQKAEQATGQLQQIDQLAEQGAIQNPDEVKWRMVLGPEAERGMFPQQIDPREEHRKILAEENRTLEVVKAYVTGNDGRLYQAKEEKVGNTYYYTDQPDRSKPASQDEVALWTASIGALDQLEQQKLGIVQQMADQGIPNPNRLQDLMISQEKEHWLKRAAKGYFGLTGPGLIYRGVKRVKKEFAGTSEPTGTFAQKVQQDVAPSRTQAPRTQASVMQRPRKELLAEYRKLGGSKTAKGREFADRNLR